MVQRHGKERRMSLFEMGMLIVVGAVLGFSLAKAIEGDK